MTDRARKLLHDAMELPISERAELVANLLASFDGEPEADVEAAWAAEIRARVSEIESGRARTVPWAEARRRIYAAAGRGSGA